MRCLLLIKSDASTETGTMPSPELITAMTKYNEELVKAGVLLAAEGLHPSSQGARVEVKGGRAVVKDGPFTETKELVCGFWLLQVRSREEAIEWTKRVPDDPAQSTGEGEIEVRPIFELSDFPKQENESGWREDEEAFRDAPAPKPDPAKRRYIILVKADRAYEAGAMPTEKGLADMGVVVSDMIRAGALLSCEGLKPTSNAAKVKVSRGKRAVLDGPFTEAKEIVAGFTLFQAKDDAEALEWAKRHALAAPENPMELRRIFSEADFPAELVQEAAPAFEAERRRRESLER